jgi:hypothetical protein
MRVECPPDPLIRNQGSDPGLAVSNVLVARNGVIRYPLSVRTATEMEKGK